MELKPKVTLFGNFIPVFLYFPSGHILPAVPCALLHYAGVKLLLEDHEMLGHKSPWRWSCDGCMRREDGTDGCVGILVRAGEGGKVDMGRLNIAVHLIGCLSVDWPWPRFRELIDCGILFLSWASRGMYEAPFFTDRSQLSKKRNEPFNRRQLWRRWKGWQ